MAKKKEAKPLLGAGTQTGQPITEPTLEELDKQIRALCRKKEALAKSKEEETKAKKLEEGKAKNAEHLAEAQAVLSRVINACFVFEVCNDRFEQTVSVRKYLPGTEAVIAGDGRETFVLIKLHFQKIKIGYSPSEAFGKTLGVETKQYTQKMAYCATDKYLPMIYITGVEKGKAPIDFPNHIFDELWNRYTIPPGALAAFVIDGKTLPVIRDAPDGTKTMFPQ